MSISFVTHKNKNNISIKLFVFCFSREKNHFDYDLLRGEIGAVVAVTIW